MGGTGLQWQYDHVTECFRPLATRQVKCQNYQLVCTRTFVKLLENPKPKVLKRDMEIDEPRHFKKLS